jgi:hypothetical protein
MTAPIPTIDRRPDRPEGGAPPQQPLRWWLIALGAVVLVAVTAALVLFLAARTADEGTAPDGQPTAPAPDDETEPADEPVIRYGSEPRANWDVTGVAAADVLNVRTGPRVSFPVTATLAPDAAELESTGRIATAGDELWREIVVPGATTGWVNARYLTEYAPPAWLEDIGVGLPAPAATTAREIALLARRGSLADLAGIAMAGEEPFTASFGQEAMTPAQLEALWEAIGRDEVLQTIGALVALPDWYETQGEVGGEPIAIYVTPRFMHETTDANRRLLEEALGVEAVSASIVDGQWLGWRLGIDAAGDWRFFVTGD